MSFPARTLSRVVLPLPLSPMRPVSGAVRAPLRWAKQGVPSGKVTDRSVKVSGVRGAVGVVMCSVFQCKGWVR